MALLLAKKAASHLLNELQNPLTAISRSIVLSNVLKIISVLFCFVLQSCSKPNLVFNCSSRQWKNLSRTSDA